MTKAQEVKKACKGHFQNLKCIGGRGTAYGWVTLEFDEKKLENCTCDPIRWYHCQPCANVRSKAEEKVYALIKKQAVKLYTYCSDDGSGMDRDCMIIHINLV